MEISYDYIKKRREFGKHPSFDHMTAFVMESIPSIPGPDPQWTQRQSTTTQLSCIPQMTENSVNTERFVQKDQIMFHGEGGWPKEVNSAEFKERERHLRRIENEDSYRTSVKSLVSISEKVVMQNNTIDMYEEYFTGSFTDHAPEPPSAKTLTVFRDPNQTHRSATQISWHPDGAAKLAVSYAILSFQQMPEDLPVSSYIWDVNNPTNPNLELIPPSPLCSIVYNPKNADYLVGGSYNGLISFWDIRKGSSPVEKSIVEKSHHDPVYQIQWIQSRSGNECCSVSTDGHILWWDIRKLATGPTDSMAMSSPDAESDLFGGTALEYRSDAGATRFLVGTEQGAILNIERKAKKDFDSQKSIRMVYGEDSSRHHGPVYSVQRNPLNLKFFLSVGDWTAKIWMEDLKSPILSTRFEQSYLTAGCWSPTRPGVFYTTKLNGTLDIWDLFYRHNDPVFTTRVGEASLTSIAVQGEGRLVAVGASDGCTTLLEVCPSLYEPQNNEKQSISQMLERENKREKNLELRSLQQKRERKTSKLPPGASELISTEQEAVNDNKASLLTEIERQFNEMMAAGDEPVAKVGIENVQGEEDVPGAS